MTDLDRLREELANATWSLATMDGDLKLAYAREETDALIHALEHDLEQARAEMAKEALLAQEAFERMQQAEAEVAVLRQAYDRCVKRLEETGIGVPIEADLRDRSGGGE